MNELVQDTLQSGVSTLLMNMPDRRNALSLEMREALLTRLEKCLADDECQAIVLTGSGGNFCAGGDLKSERPADAAVAQTLRHKLSRLQALVRAIAGAGKPVVAAVDGLALGAGMSLALACDVVVASDGSRFGAVFGKVGLTPDAGLFYTLARRVGGARAQNLMLSARLVEAPEALTIGLADAVVEPAALLERARSEALALARIAPLAFAAIKAVGHGGCTSLEQAFTQEMQLLPLLGLTQDNREGRQAFAERRPPSFRGY
ncbi:enoyl-CoA hydratase-related protein [uncultured Pseudacidovorax sp.]|uniref:enoyl-CoA hydratase/isomerase family protein n=1 Tax=uncultured Pseudacidovorax sp. TaxID=679313 RepID=UPI0025CBC56E|nr:enoyl-CoA hydratase-related protein [uncultured Pseudacidovorax sp.]